MGIPSYVNLKLPCPYCGNLLKGFQSKDGIEMQINEPWTLYNFYDFCDNCKSWVEYRRKDGINNTELIKDGMEAINLLREFIEIESTSKVFYAEYAFQKVDLRNKIQELLDNTKYPKDNWLDSYELKV